MLKRSTYIVVLLCNVMFFAGTLALGLSLGAGSAEAACSPGIPCTPPDFDLYSEHDAGETATNGPKSGKTVYTDTACDGNFMNQIYSKAYMEGHRQVIMSEQIIHKPDSVLEYTCFEGYINDTASIESEFSYTDRWDTGYEQDRETADGSDDIDSSRIDDQTVTYTLEETGSPQRVYREDFNDDDTDCPSSGPSPADSDVCANNLAEALNYIVNDTLNTYLANNFSHTYLGEATTIDASGTPSGCADMATVWDIAKCLDFGEDDRFRTFESLVNADPRSIPQECSPGNSFSDDVEAGTSGTKLDSTSPSNASNVISAQCPPAAAPVAGVNTNISTALINVANNCANSSGEHAYVDMDIVDYIDFTTFGAGQNSGFYIPGTGGSTSGTVNCRPPIPTGIPVITIEHDPNVTGTIPELFEIPLREKYIHYEYICTNPGCYYRPNKVLIAETAPIPASTPIGFCAPY